MQHCGNSSALALELPQSCAKPSYRYPQLHFSRIWNLQDFDQHVMENLNIQCLYLVICQRWDIIHVYKNNKNLIPMTHKRRTVHQLRLWSWRMGPIACCWNYYPGTLSFGQVAAIQMKIRHPSIKPTGAWSGEELQWLDCKIGQRCSSPSNGHQGDIPN